MYKVAHTNKVLFVEIVVEADVLERKTLSSITDIDLCFPFTVGCADSHTYVWDGNTIVKLVVKCLVC